MEPGDRLIVDHKGLGALFDSLRARGYDIVGPTVRDGAIVYDHLRSPTDLPFGWGDEQEAGRYRLRKRDDRAAFGYGVGPHSWKKLLHPPALTLWRAHRGSGGFDVETNGPEATRYAFIGVRACELAAIAVQDRVLIGGAQVDVAYKARREGIFVVAVHCTQAGGTCFCASLGTGPRAVSGFDLALTELLDGGRHAFVVEVGTDEGAKVAAEVPHEAARAEDVRAAEDAVARAAAGMKRALETGGLHEALLRNYESAHWDEVASRCLTCGNCTLVCPTCFCFSVEDVTNLDGGQAERRRRWDSCFAVDFSYIHGGSVRSSTAARYRLWITHKLATWHDQFGSSGCVGCGRCITWCPVGIDITEEARAVCQDQGG